MIKVRVDVERCQGHGVCYMTSPSVFQISEEDGHAFVPTEEVAPGLAEDARRGADSCPELAITID